MADLEDPEPPDPRIGNVLQGRYKILSRIASGAMGVVYRGERVQLGRAVAIKFLHPWIAAQKAFLSRFENEAKAMSRLSHPHCVSVIDFGIEGAPYLVMDFVTGKTVRELMQEGPLPPARAIRLAEQLLAGLSHAHAQGIVHRDLKPENVILSADEGLSDHLRILDFGLAKLRDGPAMTTGLAVGTPSYMSPEQSGTDAPIDARTDLYTVGVLLFELLAGRKPFQSENVGELILMQREVPAPLLREVAPALGYSAALEGVLHKAMAKRPEDRFQSAAQMSAALLATPEARPPGAAGDRQAAPEPREKPSKADRGGFPFGKPRPAAPVKAAGKPAAPPDATTVDTISAVRRRIDAAAAPPGGAPETRQWRLGWIGAGVVLLAMLGLLIGRALRSHPGTTAATETAETAAGVGRPAPAPTHPGGAAALPANTAPGTAGTSAADNARVDQARQLIAQGQAEQAIALLNQIRVEQPENADVPYLLAMTYFDQRRWADGLAAAQLAVRKNPALKADGDLIKAAIRSLANDHGYERSQSFLRSLGAPAIPFIKEAARHDANPRVRDRASELLNERGGGRGWSSRSSSSSSSSSVFRR